MDKFASYLVLLACLATINTETAASDVEGNQYWSSAIDIKSYHSHQRGIRSVNDEPDFFAKTNSQIIVKDPRTVQKQGTLMEAISGGKPVFFYARTGLKEQGHKVQVLDAAPAAAPPDLALFGYVFVGIGGSLLVFARVALKSIQSK